MLIYLDDVRDPSTQNFGGITQEDLDQVVIVRSYPEFAKALVEAPTKVSFDHDLGEGPSGMDAFDFLERMCCLHGWDIDEIEIYVHSANPVGRDNILRGLEAARRRSEEARARVEVFKGLGKLETNETIVGLPDGSVRIGNLT